LQIRASGGGFRLMTFFYEYMWPKSMLRLFI
jgi:hypothetical protein